MKRKRQKEWESALQETRLVITPTCNLAQSVSQLVTQSLHTPHHAIATATKKSDIRLQTHFAILVLSTRPAVQSVKGLATVAFQFQAQNVSQVCSASRVAQYRPAVPRMDVTHDQG